MLSFMLSFTYNTEARCMHQSDIIVHSLSSDKVEMFLCFACHAFTPHVNAWKR